MYIIRGLKVLTIIITINISNTRENKVYKKIIIKIAVKQIALRKLYFYIISLVTCQQRPKFALETSMKCQTKDFSPFKGVISNFLITGRTENIDGRH